MRDWIDRLERIDPKLVLHIRVDELTITEINELLDLWEEHSNDEFTEAIKEMLFHREGFIGKTLLKDLKQKLQVKEVDSPDRKKVQIFGEEHVITRHGNFFLLDGKYPFVHYRRINRGFWVDPESGYILYRFGRWMVKDNWPVCLNRQG